MALYATYSVLVVYYLLFFSSLCYNLPVIVDMEQSKISIFVFSQVMHFIFICTALLGVYSRSFENGGVQVFFFVMCNIYMYALAYLSWPVRTFLKEYEIDE